MQQGQIPEGLKLAADGTYHPISKIKPIDLARDSLVQEIVSRAKPLNESIAEFKTGVMGDIKAFVDLSAEEYGAKVGGKKGNLTLYSFDGRYKVQLSVADRIEFDERLQAAKVLIDKCINSWQMDDNARVLINEAFRVDKQGKISTGKVLGLRRLNIDTSDWKEAMRAISDSVQVVGSKSYIRIYERDDETEKYVAITLDVAAD